MRSIICLLSGAQGSTPWIQRRAVSAGAGFVLLAAGQAAHGELGAREFLHYGLDSGVPLDLLQFLGLAIAAYLADGRFSRRLADSHHPAALGPAVELLAQIVWQFLRRLGQKMHLDAAGGIEFHEADVVFQVVLELGV